MMFLPKAAQLTRVSLCCLTIATAAGAQTTWHVDTDAAGAENGLTWCDAFHNPQDALAVAAAGDTIRVAEGTYMPDGGYTPVGGSHVSGTGDRTATFQLLNGVTLEGGLRRLRRTRPRRTRHVAS